MKKRFFTLFLCLIFAICLISHASAINIVEVDFFLPSKSEYVELDSPYLASANDSYTVIFDDKGLNVIGENNYVLSSSETFSSAVIYGDILVAAKNDYSTYVVNLNTKAKINVSEFSSLEDVFYVSLYKNKLYILNGVDLICYDVSDISKGVVSKISSVKFRNAQSFEVSESDVFYYRFDSGSHYLCSDSKKIKTESSISAITISSGTVYVLFGDGKTVSSYNCNDLSLIKTYSLSDSYSNLFSLKNNLYLTNVNKNRIDLYLISNESLSYQSSICSSGDTNGRFNTPSSVYAHENNVVVADTGNNRIQIFDFNGNHLKNYSLNVAPESAVSFGDRIYFVSNNKIFSTTGGAVTEYSSASGSVFTNLKSLTIDSSGTVYAIDGNRIVSKNQSSDYFTTFANVSPIDLAVSPKGSVLYALYKNKIDAYDSNGTVIFSSTAISNISDSAFCDTDVNGNMFIVDGIELIKLSRSFSDFTKSDSFVLSSNKTLECSSISVSTNGTIFLSGKDTHAVYTLSQSISGAAVYNPSAFTTPVDVYEKTPLSAPVGFVKVNAGGGFVYDFSQSYENTRVVAENTLLYLLSPNEINGFYYVYYSGKAGFIPTSSVSTVSPSSYSQYDAFALYSTTLYKYPTIDSNDSFALCNIEKGTSFKVVGNACNFTSLNKNDKNIGWCEVLYNDNIYYIEINKIGVVNPSRPTEYGYAKLRTDTISKKIQVFALPNEASAVIGEYSDGTEVKLLTNLDKSSTFTQIQIGDVVGYVQTANLTTDGLTTAQIVILILVLLGGAASVTILVVNRKMHRRS